MPKTFITDNFLLRSKTAQELYHNYARNMPIYDYHCHLSPKEIAEDRTFDNLTQIWLAGDHYKWRAMRSNGVDEKYCTGNASDYEKFEAWAKTVPYTIRNPLYHWTHLELLRYFHIDDLLDQDSAQRIYDTANEMLKTKDFSVRNLLRKMKVKVVCTTDDPVDSLEYHKKLQEDGFEILVLPAFRPDKGMAVESPSAFNAWVDKLEKVADIDIKDYESLLQAIKTRHDFFHAMGCRLSDHGVETVYAEDYTETEVIRIFEKVRSGKNLDQGEILKFKSAMMKAFAIMDHEKNWTHQIHLGALRNKNTRMFEKIGPDTGFDSIGDFEIARPLSRFLDSLDVENKLPKTIVYNLNPCDNEVLATILGNFQDGSIPGKMQFGSAWWFLDQKDGMEKQMNALSNLGLLSRFVGMLTDSRSFLSYPRHEYFRRILCNLLGNDVENQELPNNTKFLGQIVENICFNNAKEYFGIAVE
jgi:glucuronate isomerase